MKKLIILFFIIFVNANEIELFENLFPQLFQKKEIKIYTYKYAKFNSSVLKKVNNCQSADIVLGEIKCDKPKFLLNYYNFKKDKKAIGAFYWRKGRPQLRLRKENILYYNLHLSKAFSEYLE